MEELNIEYVREFLKITDLPFKASQHKVSFPVLCRIYRRLKDGTRFNPIHVDGNIIINGHHRFICLSILGIEVERSPWISNSTATVLTPWPDLVVDHDDYDTEAERESYSRQYDSVRAAQPGN